MTSGEIFGWSVFLLSVANLTIWGTVFLRTRWYHRRQLVDGIRTAALVALLSVSAGGSVSSLGFVDVLPSEASATIATAWRTAMLVCGLYALWASVLAARKPT